MFGDRILRTKKGASRPFALYQPSNLPRSSPIFITKHYPKDMLRIRTALPQSTLLSGPRFVFSSGATSLYNRSIKNSLPFKRTLATTSAFQPQNMIEKIAQRYAVDLAPNHTVRSGDFVTIRPEHVLTHDNTGAVISKFKSIGAASFKDPKQPVFALDHDVQNKSDKNLAKYATIEAFAGENKVDFYPAGRGIGHQVMVEEGYAFPGTLTVASDSHSNMYGGIGALGTPIVRTDAAAIWATGQTWWQVPPVVKVELKNKLPPGVTGKDVIITLCSVFNKDEVLNTAIEFIGDGVKYLGIEDRLAIANMTTEWGALAGVFPIDEVTREYYEKRVHVLERTRFTNKNIKPVPVGQEFVHPRINKQSIQDALRNQVAPDSGAIYSKHLTLDLSTVSPYISGPNSVKVAQSVQGLKDVKINKAYLIADGVEFYVAAASSEVQAEVEETGDWQALMEAGATPLPAGCGPCVGLGTGLLQDGEIGISATNRNFKGRMGSPKALAYLASPAVVAASAISGKINSPASMDLGSVPIPIASITTLGSPTRSGADEVSAETISNFPSQMTGELLFCPADNLNTDGIYPGKYTYQDDIGPETMRKVVMENYDTNFASIVRPSDILIGGFNFGTGSSREQAATALLSAGIKLLIAGSFSETFKRNSINNGLLLMESPELVRDLARERGTAKLTDRTGWKATVSLASGKVLVSNEGQKDKLYRVGGLGKSIQELWVAGGLEGWVKGRINQN
ncbi:mitochondrial Homoaconitase [Modicella reniformis]|uniref:Mitochondrial Homoaconitase n=1 Tax=Modicella reniformis TaxID=1440133 RepID=A0A9P6M9M5_9FUNG|nr:mitochondrial Homoaconitase [Modicella reniformis]